LVGGSDFKYDHKTLSLLPQQVSDATLENILHVHLFHYLWSTHPFSIFAVINVAEMFLLLLPCLSACHILRTSECVLVKFDVAEL
jgi:hypothetical protein